MDTRDDGVPDARSRPWQGAGGGWWRHPPPQAVDRRSTIALFALLVVLSGRLIVSTLHHEAFWSKTSPFLYHAGVLGFNYVQFGFVRRGLGGTIAYLLGPDLLVATLVFHLLSAVWFAGLACWLLRRIDAPPLVAALFAVVLIDLMLFWAEDAGRTDMAVAGLLVAATLAVLAGRPVAACLCVAVGLAIHEVSVIFGLPLLTALYLGERRYRAVPWRAATGGACVVLGTLVLYALWGRLPHAAPQTMVATIRSELPRSQEVDWALYFALSGMRGVRTSLCQNATDPNHLLHAGEAGTLIALCTFVLAGRHRATWALALLASVPPFLFLWVLANDMARWTTLSLLNVWLVCACHPVPAEAGRERFAWIRVAGALLLLPLHHPKAVMIDSGPVYTPSPMMERVARKLGTPPTPYIDKVFMVCDPGWRAVLGGPGDG